MSERVGSLIPWARERSELIKDGNKRYWKSTAVTMLKVLESLSVVGASAWLGRVLGEPVELGGVTVGLVSCLYQEVRLLNQIENHRRRLSRLTKKGRLPLGLREIERGLLMDAILLVGGGVLDYGTRDGLLEKLGVRHPEFVGETDVGTLVHEHLEERGWLLSDDEGVRLGPRGRDYFWWLSQVRGYDPGKVVVVRENSWFVWLRRVSDR